LTGLTRTPPVEPTRCLTGGRPQDQCTSSTTTYPIRATGCRLIVYEPCIRSAAALARSHRSDSGGSSQGRAKDGPGGPTHAAGVGSRNRRGVARRPGKQRKQKAERHDRNPLLARGTEQTTQVLDIGLRGESGGPVGQGGHEQSVRAKMARGRGRMRKSRATRNGAKNQKR